MARKKSATNRATAASTGDTEMGIIGSWLGSVAAQDVPLPPFEEAISFLPGGVVIESRRYAALMPPSGQRMLETTGHGAWKRTDTGTLEVFFRFLLQDEASTNGVGTDNVRLHLTLEGDSLTGTFESEVLDTSGKSLGKFQGTYLAKRITV